MVSERQTQRWMEKGLVLIGLSLLFGCRPKPLPQATEERPPEPTPAPGYYRIGEMLCYRPPNFKKAMSPTERKVLRGDALADDLRRLRGEVDPGFQIDEWILQNIEASLMTHPEKIETFLEEEHRRCHAHASGELSKKRYYRFFEEARRKMAREECAHPPFDLISIYVDVEEPWSESLRLCKGEKIDLKVLAGRYTLDWQGSIEASLWISIEGNREIPADETLPCHTQGCFPGTLIARFITDKGRIDPFPIGSDAHFEAPGDGELSFGINDTTFYNNRFHEKEAVMDFLLIEVRPSREEERSRP